MDSVDGRVMKQSRSDVCGQVDDLESGTRYEGCGTIIYAYLALCGQRAGLII